MSIYTIKSRLDCNSVFRTWSSFYFEVYVGDEVKYLIVHHWDGDDPQTIHVANMYRGGYCEIRDRALGGVRYRSSDWGIVDPCDMIQYEQLNQFIVRKVSIDAL